MLLHLLAKARRNADAPLETESALPSADERRASVAICRRHPTTNLRLWVSSRLSLRELL
jgi:hypothetical protein